MKRNEVKKLIITKINAIQQISGREIIPLTDGMRPIGDLAGFDSMNSLELAVELSDQIALPEDFNPCISEDGKRALTIDEITQRVCSHLRN